MHWFDILKHPDAPDGLRISLSPDLQAALERIADGLCRPAGGDQSQALADLKQGQAAILAAIQSSRTAIMTDLTTITADVAANTSAEQSAATLLASLKAQLDAAGTDPVALKALSDQLEANNAALSAAVVANTPAAPVADPNAPTS